MRVPHTNSFKRALMELDHVAVSVDSPPFVLVRAPAHYNDYC
jgi:hypothetical protein